MWPRQLADLIVTFVVSLLFVRLIAKRVADHADKPFNTQQAVFHVQ